MDTYENEVDIKRWCRSPVDTHTHTCIHMHTSSHMYGVSLSQNEGRWRVDTHVDTHVVNIRTHMHMYRDMKVCVCHTDTHIDTYKRCGGSSVYVVCPWWNWSRQFEIHTHTLARVKQSCHICGMLSWWCAKLRWVDTDVDTGRYRHIHGCL